MSRMPSLRFSFLFFIEWSPPLAPALLFQNSYGQENEYCCNTKIIEKVCDGEYAHVEGIVSAEDGYPVEDGLDPVYVYKVVCHIKNEYGGENAQSGDSGNQLVLCERGDEAADCDINGGYAEQGDIVKNRFS